MVVMVMRVNWERLAESPVREVLSSHLWENISEIRGEVGDMESEWTVFMTTILDVAAKSCVLKVVGACRGSNQRNY